LLHDFAGRFWVGQWKAFRLPLNVDFFFSFPSIRLYKYKVTRNL
jgi:hypothetical protein